MTNPPEDNRVAGGTGFSDAHLRRLLDQQGEPESETQKLVRLRTTATEAYTALHAVYEELRESGHAFAWATAYEASRVAGMLLADLGDVLNDRQSLPPTPQPTPAPTPPCRSTQHCAAWGWCHRCDPVAATVVPYIVKAVDAMGVRPDRAGSTYAAIMELLRQSAALGMPLSDINSDQGDPCPGK